MLYLNPLMKGMKSEFCRVWGTVQSGVAQLSLSLRITWVLNKIDSPKAPGKECMCLSIGSVDSVSKHADRLFIIITSVCAHTCTEAHMWRSEDIFIVLDPFFHLHVSSRD